MDVARKMGVFLQEEDGAAGTASIDHSMPHILLLLDDHTSTTDRERERESHRVDAHNFAKLTLARARSPIRIIASAENRFPGEEG